MKLKLDYLLYSFLFIAPTSICTIVMGNISTIMQFVLFALACVYILSLDKLISPNRSLRIFAVTYILPLFLSYIIAHLSLLIIGDVNYENYVYTGMISRIINVVMLLLITLVCFQIYKKNGISPSNVIVAYLSGIFVFLVLFGILQILNIVLGIPIPDIGTRTHVHSMSSDAILSNVGFQLSRVTSLANEPSYLAPFLIDALILSLFINKKIISLVLLVVCVFTLSLGCYANIFLLLCYYVYLNIKSFNVKHLLLFVLIGVVAFFLLYDFMTPFINVVLNRSELSFDAGVLLQSSRIYVIWTALISLFSGSFFNILFGFGPGSFEYLSSTSGYLPSGDLFYVTSNNLFVDILYEGGVVSLILIVCYFVALYKMTNKFPPTKDTILCKLLIMHLMISSMYRADFVSIRFFALVFIFSVFEDNLLIDRKNSGLHRTIESKSK